ncbi:MAG: hypothetical protein IJ625_06295 [Acidaminococcaceae bacterium]|nr:hypothetical protein [Acidaminococcaceae bacterium]
MLYSDRQTARDESDRATTEALIAKISTSLELYKAVQANESLKKWIYDMVFNATYIPPEDNEHKHLFHENGEYNIQKAAETTTL